MKKQEQLMKSNDEIIAEFLKADNDGDFAKVLNLWHHPLNLSGYPLKSSSDMEYIYQQTAHIIVNAYNALRTPPTKPSAAAERLDEILLLARS
jgi:hypothetical protein